MSSRCGLVMVLAAALVGCGCGERQAPAAPGEVVFRDGHRLSAALEPETLEPGAPVEVRLEGSTSGPLQLSLMPPRVAGRQVARGGGPAAPDPPPDPRVQTVMLDTASEPVTFSVPRDWHAATAVLVAQRPGVRVVDGPRTADGRGILALVPVAVRPTSVVAASATPAVDGRVAASEDGAWTEAFWTPLVDSRDGEPEMDLRTEIAFAWDADSLYMAVRAEDADVWSTHESRDAALWEQEAVELFIFGDDSTRDYLEYQVAPTGAVFDARFETYRRGDVDWNGAWRHAVLVDGTVHDRRDRDRGFTMELAVPWTEICAHTEVTCPPRVGTRFRVNAFRLDRTGGRKPRVRALALSPPQVPDFHAAANAATLELR